MATPNRVLFGGHLTLFGGPSAAEPHVSGRVGRTVELLVTNEHLLLLEHRTRGWHPGMAAWIVRPTVRKVIFTP